MCSDKVYIIFRLKERLDVKSKTMCKCHITLNLYLGLYLDYRHDLFSSSVISSITFLDLREG